MRAVLKALLLSTLLLLAMANLATAAEKRVALVIGNSNYRFVPSLANPANDARLMAGTLSELGFTLVGDGALVDLDKAAMDDALRGFGTQLQGADVGLFYYAGHGLQVRGTNYLVPTGANPVRETDVDFELDSLSLVLRQMEDSGARLNLVMLDACRSNSLWGPRPPRYGCGARAGACAGRNADLLCHPTGQRRAGRRGRRQPLFRGCRTDDPSAGTGRLRCLQSGRCGCEESDGRRAAALAVIVAD
jgi:hypothetical protein